MRMLKINDNKRIRIDTHKDIELYATPRNPPNTGMEFTRGADLYMHIAKSSEKYFYFDHWSLHQGEGGSYELIDKDKAEDFILEKMKLGGVGSLSKNEIETIEKYLPEIFEETG